MGKNKYYCKINGTICNLSGAQDILDGKSDQSLVMWLYENHIFDDTIDANIFSLVVEFNNGEIPEDYDVALKEFQENNRSRLGMISASSNELEYSQHESKSVVKNNGKNKYYCKINGVIHNLSGAKDILDGKSDQNLVMWLYENHIFDDTVDANIFSLVVEFNNGEIPADYDEVLKQYRESNRRKFGIKEYSGNGRCPRCGNAYISKPIFSLYDYKCGTCGHEWVRCPRCGGSNIKIRKIPPVSAVKNSLNKCKDCGHDWRRI